MSIIISNDGSNPGPTGIHHYTVKINSTLICEFGHRREDGLAECLRKAAEAVDKARDIEQTNNLINLYKLREAYEREKLK